MRLRPIVLSTIAVGLVAASSALAAPKTACKIVNDREGDGRSAAIEVLSSPALDILSADLATGKKDVKGIIRLKTTNTNGDPAAYLGMKWSLAFQIQSTNYSFTLSRSTTPMGVRETASATLAGQSAEVTAALTGDTITFTVARKAFASTLVKKPGKLLLENVSAMSYVNGGNADSAIGTPPAKYLDLSPSCLKAS